MARFNPSLLPAITSVDVLILTVVDAEFGIRQLRRTDGPRCITVDGDAAQQIADLWRALPPGKQARCHIPPYALRFRSGDRVLCEASICWKCSNIHGEIEGQGVGFEFDASHPTSIHLLAAIRQAVSTSDR